MYKIDDDVEGLKALSQRIKDIRSEIAKVIIGQEDIVEQLMISIFAKGHVLLIGVPGLAKTLLVRTLSQALDLKFSRIQFTPDLMPGDITGTEVIEENVSTKEKVFRFVKGPIFANIVLADEINRTPPKTQAALLQAMEEKEVTASGTTYKQEGTYPLPEAQVDRFLLKVKVSYPGKIDEMRILESVSGAGLKTPNSVATKDDILNARKLVKSVYVDERIREYIVNLVLATRDPASIKRNDLVSFIEVGASRRASIGLAQAGKAHAFIQGRAYVTPEYVKAVAMEVMRHRFILSYEA